MGTQCWPIHRRLARAARPGGVAATMTGTGGVTDKDLSRGERVTIRAALRRANDPRVIRGQHQVADLSAPPLAVPPSPRPFGTHISDHHICSRAMRPPTAQPAWKLGLARSGWHAGELSDPLRTIAQTIAASDAKVPPGHPLNGASNCGNRRDSPVRQRSQPARQNHSAHTPN